MTGYKPLNILATNKTKLKHEALRSAIGIIIIIIIIIK